MKSINGSMLKQMMISGSNHLYNHYPEIDILNVFPVPDGDTGVNMNLTMSSGAKEIANRNDDDIYEIAKAFSKGLLMGARGNSGVILSQIFRGFAQSLEGKKAIKPVDLIEAFNNGKEVAYKAVLRPVEGTILTVVREASDVLSRKADNSYSIEEAFSIFLKEAEASLQRTPELLPILKEAGVVDSGGAGFVTILKGMQSALEGEVISKSQATAMEESAVVGAGMATDNQEFGYCTEFIMRLVNNDNKKPFAEKRFTSVLSAHGNSLVVVRDEDVVKVHVHTLNPGEILAYAIQFGDFLKIKVENMTEQHNALESGTMTNEKPQESNENKEIETKEYALIAVSAGSGIDERFKELNIDQIVTGGQTMNPSTEDFIEAIKKAHAKNVFILPNNSNIVMAASQACDVIEEGISARVVPSKTIPQGMVAAMTFNPYITPEENFKEMKSSLKTVKSGSVTFAIKDTEIDGVEVKKDYFMGLSDKKIICCVKDKFDALKQLLTSMVDDSSSVVTILVGQDVKDDEQTLIQEYCEDKYKDIEFDIYRGEQPVYSFFVGVE